MRGRALKIALIAWVGTLLVAPAAAYVLGVRSHANENRALATAPPLSISTIVHSSAWHRAAAAFSDHLPLRDRMIRWRAEVEFKVFSDSPNPSVVIVGRDHWLFLHEEFDVCTAWPTVQPLWVAQAFELAYAAAKASGRELRIMIIPAKSTIEADHYRSSHYSFERCARARERRLEALLRGQPGVIDLWSALRAAKREGDLWLENDSHTDTAGSIVIARSLVRSLRPTSWQEGLETSGAAYGYSGDLGVLAGIPTSDPRHRLVLHGRPRNPIRAPLLALSDSQLEASDPEILPYFPARQELGIDLLVARNPCSNDSRRAHTGARVGRAHHIRASGVRPPLAADRRPPARHSQRAGGVRRATPDDQLHAHADGRPDDARRPRRARRRTLVAPPRRQRASGAATHHARTGRRERSCAHDAGLGASGPRGPEQSSPRGPARPVPEPCTHRDLGPRGRDALGTETRSAPDRAPRAAAIGLRPPQPKGGDKTMPPVAVSRRMSLPSET